jgi:hypothetical protein
VIERAFEACPVNSSATAATAPPLSRPAAAYRAAHAAFAIAQLTSLGYVWGCALTGRRDSRLAAAVGFLALEGVALVIGRGNCPLGPFQARLGDPVPLFELVLPPRAAKAAVPVLTAVTLTGMAALVVLPPGLGGWRSNRP